MKTMIPFLLLVSATGAAIAQDPIGADGQVPPALRNRSATAPPTAGAALRAQALAKLEQQFRAADRDHNGSLTPDEAKAFGFVANNFAAIDTARRGGVSFDELRAYLERASAQKR